MKSNPFTVVVWGDSIAAGNDEMNWPDIAQSCLDAVINTGQPVKIINAAICGMPASKACSEFSERIAPHNPNLVFIQFGFNDIRHDGSRGELPLTTPDEFADCLRTMIQNCRQKLSAEVCLLGNHKPHVNLLMPTGLTYDESRIKYNKIAQAIAEETGMTYHDISQVIEKSDFSYKEIVCNDGVHLSKRGYNFYGRFIAEIIRSFLTDQK